MNYAYRCSDIIFSSLTLISWTTTVGTTNIHLLAFLQNLSSCNRSRSVFNEHYRFLSYSGKKVAVYIFGEKLTMYWWLILGASRIAIAIHEYSNIRGGFACEISHLLFAQTWKLLVFECGPVVPRCFSFLLANIQWSTKRFEHSTAHSNRQQNDSGEQGTPKSGNIFIFEWFIANKRFLQSSKDNHKADIYTLDAAKSTNRFHFKWPLSRHGL